MDDDLDDDLDVLDDLDDIDLDGGLAGVAQRDPQDWEERIFLRMRGLDIF